MGLIDLLISCEIENVSAISFGGLDYEWHFKIKCTQCQSETDEIYFKGSEQKDIVNSRGQCNFQMKCKTFQFVVNITLVKSPDHAAITNKTKNVLLAQFECRGCELIKWNPQNLFVKSESDQIFENADLTDVWVEYDDKTQSNVLIENFKYAFVRSK